MSEQAPDIASANLEAREILRRNLEATILVKHRLAYSKASVEPLFPMNLACLEEIGDADEEKIDALLFRFSSAFSMVQDHLFKSIAIVEEENISESSRRDVANLMEKLGAIRSSQDMTTLSSLRNKVSHVYPDMPEKQCEILNGIYHNVPVLLSIIDDLSAYVVRKKLIDLDVGLEADREADVGVGDGPL